MKKQINKSEIMKRAWELYKSFDNKISSWETEMSFAECLKESWMIAKTTKQDIYNIINEESVATIQGILINQDFFFNQILTVVAEKSNGYQSDIASKGLKYGKLTEKQAWCVAYEFKNVA